MSRAFSKSEEMTVARGDRSRWGGGEINSALIIIFEFGRSLSRGGEIGGV